MPKWVVVIAIVAACKGSSSSAPAVGSGSGSGSAVATVAVDAAAPVPVVVDAWICRQPKCLYAAELPLADAIAKHASECKAEWYAGDDCEGLLYARNCIYAAYGNVFKTPAWKDKFTADAWYKPNPKFKDSDIPAVAMTNIRELKKQYEACATPIPPVSAEDKALADTWYPKVAHGDEAIDGIDADDLQSIRSTYANLYPTEKTKYTYDAAPQDGRRTITLSGLLYAAGPGTWKPDESFSLTFEGDKLVEAR